MLSLRLTQPVRRTIVLFAVAFALRGGYVLVYPQVPVESDAATFRTIGANLAAGRGYTEQDPEHVNQVAGTGEPEYWSPGYPLMLAVIFRLFGTQVLTVRVIQALLSAATVLLVAGIARKLFGSRVALIAGTLAVLYPASIFYTGVLVTETGYTFLVTAVVYLLLRKPLDWRTAAIVGVLLGFGGLMRSDTLGLPFLVLLLATVAVWVDPARDPPLSHRVAALAGSGLVMIVAMCCVIAPWTARNYSVYGRVVLVDAHGGHALWISTYPEDWLEWKPWPAELKAKLDGLNAEQKSTLLREEAFRNLLAYPGAYVRMSAKRFVRFWTGSHTGELAGFRGSFVQALTEKRLGVLLTKASLLGLNSLVVLAGFIGAWRFMRSSTIDAWSRAIVLSPILFKTALHTLLFSTSRYQVPIMPLMIVLAAYWVGSLGVLSFAQDGAQKLDDRC